MTDCYQYIIHTLSSWGVTCYTGVTGGGLVHLLKYLPPFNEGNDGQPGFLYMGEYAAGFIPLGYYLGSGRVAAAVATTGAATKLITCGLSDAKLHHIPAVYIVPVSVKSVHGCLPLQDTSAAGSNMIAQLRAELPGSVFLLDDPGSLAMHLTLAKAQLDHAMPVVLVLDNEALKDQLPALPEPVSPDRPVPDPAIIEAFVGQFVQAADGKRIVILVGEEMARNKEAPPLISAFSRRVGAAVIWSINGANAVDRHNPYGYGYISFGGNDKALALYSSLGVHDVLLVLGACADEYTLNFQMPAASSVFYVSHIAASKAVAPANDERHYAYFIPPEQALQQLLAAASRHLFSNRPAAPAPAHLNDQPFMPVRAGYADARVLYQRLDEWWPAGSIGFDDVCLAYKDRQYVTQRPNDRIRFYSLYRGSAMGGAFGAAIGARLANPGQRVFLFTGDGCFRLIAGCLGEAVDLGLVVFLLNNGSLSIVEQGLQQILPHIPREQYHAGLTSLDYCGIARACGWEAERLLPDLSNLTALLHRLDQTPARSLLIEVPVDPQQVLGSNPRLKNL